MNFLPGRLTHIEPTGATVTLPDGSTVRAAVDATMAKPDDAVTLGIRPEHVTLGTGADSSVQAEVALSSIWANLHLSIPQVRGSRIRRLCVGKATLRPKW